MDTSTSVSGKKSVVSRENFRAIIIEKANQKKIFNQFEIEILI